MQIDVTYAIALGVLFGACFLLQIFCILRSRARKALQPLIRKWLLYTTIFKRQPGTSDCNVLSAIILVCFIGGNIYGGIWGVSSEAELSRRLGNLCLINLMPLFLGGRTSYIVDRVLRIDLSNYLLMHRWIGRVCLVHGLSHGAVIFAKDVTKLGGIEIAVSTLFSSEGRGSYDLIIRKLLAILASIAILSFLLVRRRIYEIFLLSHACAAPAILVLLWFHVPSRSTLFTIVVGTASALWAFQKIIWVGFFVYRNGGIRPSNMASITQLAQGSMNGGAEIEIALRRPWNIIPGQYIYITVPRVHNYGLGFWEAHPFFISWAKGEGTMQSVVLLLEEARGFSRSVVRSMNDHPRVIIDGPYGRKPSTDKFDKVLFMTSGIGIAAHLLLMRHLVTAHNSQTARVRRMTMVWVLHGGDQVDWALNYLQEILSLDQREIVNIHIYPPPNNTVVVGVPHIFSMEENLHIGYTIEQEWAAEAGNMAVHLCGPPNFEGAVRRAIRASAHDIALFTSSFQPDESFVSSSTAARFDG